MLKAEDLCSTASTTARLSRLGLTALSLKSPERLNPGEKEMISKALIRAARWPHSLQLLLVKLPHVGAALDRGRVDHIKKKQ